MSGDSEFITPEEWQHITEKERQKISNLICKGNRQYAPFHSVNVPDTFYVKHGKRILDFFIGMGVFVITIPINVLIGVITFFDVGRPILFVQERIGKNGKSFNLIKFRNMTNETNKDGILLPPSKRVTKWGKFIRKISLDELLNFWNIVKGEMSIIGPRPMPKYYNERFSDYYSQRHLVRPGLECPLHEKQFKNSLWDSRLENDIWYIQNISLKTDLKLVWLLLLEVLSIKDRKYSAEGLHRELIGFDKEGHIIHEGNIPRKYLEMIKPEN